MAKPLVYIGFPPHEANPFHKNSTLSNKDAKTSFEVQSYNFV